MTVEYQLEDDPTRTWYAAERVAITDIGNIAKMEKFNPGVHYACHEGNVYIERTICGMGVIRVNPYAAIIGEPTL